MWNSIPAKSLKRLLLWKLIPAKSFVKPKSQKSIHTKCQEKNVWKFLPKAERALSPLKVRAGTNQSSSCTELQNLPSWRKYDTEKSGVLLSSMQNIGGENDQNQPFWSIFQNNLPLSVKVCLKFWLYEVLMGWASFMRRNVEILGQKRTSFTKI